MSVSSSSSTNVAIWSAIITALATVLTSFIAIVPQMRKSDKQQIDDLTQRTANLSNQVTDLTAQLSKNVYVVSGFVKTKKDNAPVTDAILVAAPAEDSLPLDDAGKFVLQNMLNQPYWIVLQTQDGKLRRVLINPADPETDTEDLAITYIFSKE